MLLIDDSNRLNYLLICCSSVLWHCFQSELIEYILGGIMKGIREASWFIGIAAVSMAFGAANAQQYPVMDMVANKVIQKYQTSSCQQLWQEKVQGQGQPKPEMEQRAVQALQQDPQMRQAFFNMVAAPIVNKMFECGMIP